MPINERDLSVLRMVKDGRFQLKEDRLGPHIEPEGYTRDLMELEMSNFVDLSWNAGTIALSERGRLELERADK